MPRAVPKMQKGIERLMIADAPKHQDHDGEEPAEEEVLLNEGE
jgi:hypothetical protein